MTTLTSNYKFPKPIVGADAGQWGTTLNICLDMIDATFPLPGVLTANNFNLSNNPGTGVLGSLTFINSTVPPGQQRRWVLAEDASAEVGGSAGSNLSLTAYNDTGGLLSTPIAVNRASGAVTFGNATNFTGLATFATLTATGTATFNGAATFSGAATFVNLTASGTVTGANVTATGALHSNSALSVAGNSGFTGSIDVSGTSTLRNGLTVTAGLATFSGGVNGATSFNSSITVAGQTNATTVVASGAITTPDLGLPSGGAVTCPTGASLVCDSGGNWSMTVGSAGNFLLNNQNAFKPGGGSWQSISDERIKTVTGEYEAGLDEVLQLRPVTYVYKSGVDREFVGFVAQDLEQIMPSMVSQQKGFIDGEEVSDLRTVDTTELVFALCNSIKTLHAKIEALETALAARKS